MMMMMSFEPVGMRVSVLRTTGEQAVQKAGDTLLHLMTIMVPVGSIPVM